jgi:hypothetical protein
LQRRQALTPTMFVPPLRGRTTVFLQRRQALTPMMFVLL